MAGRAAFPPGEAREDWAILRALSEALGKKLGYDSLVGAAPGDLQGRAASDPSRPDRGRRRRPDQEAGGEGRLAEKAPFKPAIEDFYLTNPIARASAVMAECSRLASGQMRTAAE